jgi:hypothetical protein
MPDELTRLVPAFSCVFNNSAFLSQRVNHSKLHFVNGGVTQELAKKSGVRALTDAVEEKVTKIVNVDAQPHGQATLTPRVCALLQSLVHSMQFSHGILRLFEDQISRTQNYSQWPLIPSVDSLRSLLGSFTLHFVMAICMRLI